MINTRFPVKVTRVVDGDTFYSEPIDFDFGDFRLTIKEPKFRLYGIQAPERGKPGYQEAKNYIKDILEGHIVLVDVIGKDSFGRFLVKVYCFGQEKSVNDMLLETGLAVIYH